MQTNPFAAVLLEIDRLKVQLEAQSSEPASKGDLANVARKLYDAIGACYKAHDPQDFERRVRDILERQIPNTTGRNR